MEDANNEDTNYQSEVNTSTSEKRKREGKTRSKVWEHFTKILKEDGRCDKCQCNHCQKLFTCSSRSGTTHLLRHITDGICPIFKNTRIGLLPWKFDQPHSSSQQCMDELLPDRIAHLEPQLENEYVHWRGKLPQKPAAKGEAWMHEFRSCVAKLVELTNGKIPVGSLQALPDYSISTALKCLNEMEDIPQSSEMYLDAFEVLQDASERECFICLPPEPRRRWLQRVLHRRHPIRYTSNI